MLFKVNDPELVKREISKLKSLNYNQFRWWRRFDTKIKPLPNGSSLLDRIKNGEYEFSHYYWQAQYCELEINEKLKEYRGDIQKLLENNAVDLARRKRLWEDFNKAKPDNLAALKKEFLREFVMSSQQYEEHITNFDGTLEEFYMYCLKTFDRSGRKPGKRGRPPKSSFVS